MNARDYWCSPEGRRILWNAFPYGALWVKGVETLGGQMVVEPNRYWCPQLLDVYDLDPKSREVLTGDLLPLPDPTNPASWGALTAELAGLLELGSLPGVLHCTRRPSAYWTFTNPVGVQQLPVNRSEEEKEDSVLIMAITRLRERDPEFRKLRTNLLAENAKNLVTGYPLPFLGNATTSPAVVPPPPPPKNTTHSILQQLINNPGPTSFSLGSLGQPSLTYKDPVLGQLMDLHKTYTPETSGGDTDDG